MAEKPINHKRVQEHSATVEERKRRPAEQSHSMSDSVAIFMSISGCEDPALASTFLEMAGDNVETALSLYFEHGPATQQPAGSTADEDVAMAERLQNEAYQDPQPRAPDEAVHERLVDDVGVFPGTFGGIGGSFNPLARLDQVMYGNTRQGVFNQHDDRFNNGMRVSGDSDDEEEDDGMTPGQRKLAQMFRPPFDIISKLDLDNAKTKANREQKWVLVNIQDMGDFQCCALNRDFWKSSTVKELVQEHFIFVQYQHDSQQGEQYRNFYPFTEYPHIAILDPITGERVKMWTGIPKVSKWSDEVYDFLNEFSVDPSSVNPLVTHKPVVDPNTLSEEKQLEYAIKRSLNKTDVDSDDDNYINLDSDAEESGTGNRFDPIEIDDSEDQLSQSIPPPPSTSTTKELTEEEKLAAIKPVDHQEPSTPTTTRIQIRLGDGTRVVKKFDAESPVSVIYETVKHQFADKIGTRFFTLTSQRENLIEKLDTTIADAGLKNASILMDITDDDEE